MQLLAEDEPVGAVAQATMSAAQRGLDTHRGDEGLAHAVYLMAHLAIAAREEGEFEDRLKRLGLKVEPQPNAFDLIGAFSDAMDRHLHERCSRTDIGEMAQMAAVEALAALTGPKASNLWESTSAPVQDAVRSFSTKDGFATLAHDFFSRLMHRYLTYHLSRELSQHVGQNQRFASPTEHSEFLDRLSVHSRQCAMIVKEFAGGWYSKSKFETGVSKASAKKFAAYSLVKLRDELLVRGQNVG